MENWKIVIMILFVYIYVLCVSGPENINFNLIAFMRWIIMESEVINDDIQWEVLN